MNVDGSPVKSGLRNKMTYITFCIPIPHNISFKVVLTIIQNSSLYNDNDATFKGITV